MASLLSLLILPVSQPFSPRNLLEKVAESFSPIGQEKTLQGAPRDGQQGGAVPLPRTRAWGRRKFPVALSRFSFRAAVLQPGQQARRPTGWLSPWQTLPSLLANFPFSFLQIPEF